MIPVADLRVESQMMNPPKPTGFIVVDGENMIAVLTYETVKGALEKYEAMLRKF